MNERQQANAMTPESSSWMKSLSEQLRRATEGGSEGRVSLDPGDEDARALEAQLNRLIEAARAGSAPKKEDDAPAGAETMGQKMEKLGLFLDSILENVPTMLFVKNGEDLKVEVWNKLAEEISGVRREDILGKTGFETFPAEEMEDFHQRDWAVLRGKKLIAAEEQLTSPQGVTRWVYTKKIPLLDASGQARYLLGISEDITERKRYEQALRDAKEAAESANRAKSEFFANVSHELRTPLTLILGTLDSLLLGEAGELSSAAKERLDRIRRNGARLASLVNDLLDFSRLEAGKVEVRWEPVDASQLVSDIVTDAQATAAGRGLTLDVSTAGVGYFPLDRGMFEKITYNLLGNALKFTPAGGRVDVSLGLASGGELELCVKDTGVGVPAEELPRLFERFHQVDSSASRRYEGTGIGLALVKELSELMGGRVTVESEVGKGSRFTVRIPFRADQRDASRDRARPAERHNPFASLAPTPAEEDRLPLTGKPRLLLAEDNADMRAYVTELLSPDYDVVAVGDGKKALESARAYLPDAIVTDVMMPEMNGFELVAELKKDPALKQVPVLLLTARAGHEAIASGLEGGADDYLSKPFSPAELRARLRGQAPAQGLSGHRAPPGRAGRHARSAHPGREALARRQARAQRRRAALRPARPRAEQPRAHPDRQERARAAARRARGHRSRLRPHRGPGPPGRAAVPRRARARGGGPPHRVHPRRDARGRKRLDPPPRRAGIHRDRPRGSARRPGQRARVREPGHARRGRALEPHRGASPEGEGSPLRHDLARGAPPLARGARADPGPEGGGRRGRRRRAPPRRGPGHREPDPAAKRRRAARHARPPRGRGLPPLVRSGELRS
jgi:PAS domain S-box-containing protein